MTENSNPHWVALDRALEQALARLRSETGPLTLLFSGGVDSGLLAWELRGRPSTQLVTVGFAGAADVARAEQAAAVVGLPWRAERLDVLALERLEGKLAPDLRRVAPGRRSIFLALAAGCAAAGDRRVVVGQGTDELFLGYAHFRGLAPVDAEARAARDLALAREEDWPVTRLIASRLGRDVFAPYLTEEFIAAARQIPLPERMPSGERAKPLFRAWARHRGLPPSLAEAPKRAIQFGSGVDRWWRRVQRRDDTRDPPPHPPGGPGRETPSGDDAEAAGSGAKPSGRRSGRSYHRTSQ